MRIDIIFPRQPPAMDAIGQYTHFLAEELHAQGESVRLWVSDTDCTPINGVDIQQGFSMEGPQELENLFTKIAENPPDCLILQYNPFSYGKWGKNLALPIALRRFKKNHPNVRLIVMFHERYTPFWYVNEGKWLWQSSIMFLWQQHQFKQLGKIADSIWFSTQGWRTMFEQSFPTHKQRNALHHVGIPATIAHYPIDYSAARKRLNIPDSTFLVGFFGTAHPSRMIPLMQKTMAYLWEKNIPAELLYIGPHKDEVCAGLSRPPFLAEGPLPDEEVSYRFAAMDLYLVPIADGVSTRRTSMMVGLQHGIATLGTFTEETDAMLMQAQDNAFVLTDVARTNDFLEAALALSKDPERRQSLAQTGQAFYEENFTWKVIVAQTRRLLLADLADLDGATNK
jgi:glycosyltransferase involved in cell wall biosynthesis